jgi:hypothetical protein|tara:strand:+ start:3479 stop:4150 length:672 start_codon:yes stop_codon:yes gene_type:complete
MPNHVYHNISIGSEITKEREEILKKIEKAGGICRYYKPMPKELEGTTSPQRIGDTITKEKSEELKEKYGYDNWYDWCNAHWSTKWGCYDFEIDDEVIRFTTAWSPMNELIVKMMAQDFPDMFWSFEEEQGWGAELSIEGGDFIGVVEYDVPHFTEEFEVEVDGVTTTLTKLTEEHPHYTKNGLGWYVDWSLEFAGKTLEDAKKYLQDSGSPKDIVGEVEKETE